MCCKEDTATVLVNVTRPHEEQIHDRSRSHDIMRVVWYVGGVSQTVDEELTNMYPS